MEIPEPELISENLITWITQNYFSMHPGVKKSSRASEVEEEDFLLSEEEDDPGLEETYSDLVSEIFFYFSTTLYQYKSRNIFQTSKGRKARTEKGVRHFPGTQFHLNETEHISRFIRDFTSGGEKCTPERQRDKLIEMCRKLQYN